MKCIDRECQCPCHGVSIEEPYEVFEIISKPQTRTYISYIPFDQELHESLTNHGTYGGYNWHVRNKIAPCEPCRQANTEYTRKNRNTSKTTRVNKRNLRKRLPKPIKEIQDEWNNGCSVSYLSKKFNLDRRTINVIIGKGNMRNTGYIVPKKEMDINEPSIV